MKKGRKKGSKMGLDLFLEGSVSFGCFYDRGDDVPKHFKKLPGENLFDYLKRINIVYVRFGYCWFDEIRTLIADKIGINLDEMDGFGGNKTWETIVSPMKFLLNHSDCEGELTSQECEQMLEPLHQIITDQKYTDDEEKALNDLHYLFSESVKQNRKVLFR